MEITVVFLGLDINGMSDVDLFLDEVKGLSEEEREKVKIEFAKSLLGIPATHKAVAEQTVKFFDLVELYKVPHSIVTLSNGDVTYNPLEYATEDPSKFVYSYIDKMYKVSIGLNVQAIKDRRDDWE